MILNQAQAQAVYRAMCELNNVGVDEMDFESFEFRVVLHRGKVKVHGDDTERYENQSSFAAAYGMQ